MIFQSSRSLRTATPRRRSYGSTICHFNPRGPCGPRHRLGFYGGYYHRISILAVLADRDRLRPGLCDYPHGISILAVLADRDSTRLHVISPFLVFQSSRSLRTATAQTWPLVGTEGHFNPRGPCGPRLRDCRALKSPINFNPCGPCGPRRAQDLRPGPAMEISILAVLADRDCCLPGNRPYLPIYFNPRGPCGPRPAVRLEKFFSSCISILAVLADRDVLIAKSKSLLIQISILAVLADRDLMAAENDFWALVISILAVLADRDGAGDFDGHERAISILAVLADRDGTAKL